MATRVCRLCSAPVVLAYADHPGFQAPARYDLYECSHCETSFAEPMRVDAAIYDVVYAQSKRLPGYDRYERYRELLKSSPDPLGELCKVEDVYWGVREALNSVARKHGPPLRILELGSGLGYLTYALRQAGYDCMGADISKSAVEVAIREFGDHYRVAELSDIAASSRSGFDIVVATELIEHLPDPKAFLALAASLLAPGGALILTTPNRDIYPPAYAWDTDPPPIHLWWFSSTSLRYFAWTLGMSLSLVDFSRFYGSGQHTRVRRATKPQSLDADGNVVFRDSAIKTLARRAMARSPWLFRPLGALYLASLFVRRGRESLFRDSLTLCAILRPHDAPRLVPVARTPA